MHKGGVDHASVGLLSEVASKFADRTRLFANHQATAGQRHR